MSAITLEVTSQRGPYTILIGAGVAAELAAWLRARGTARVVVSSRRVWGLQGRRFRGALGAGDRPALIGDGERAKTLASAASLYQACLARGLDRSGAVVAVGGGVIGDVAGFAAATYLRGITLVQAPTTLLAQVDSAIGGKVGVNLPAGKNLVGAFHAPALVACDPLALRTLPRREFRAGLYEVVKYGVIASRALFDEVRMHLDAIFAQDAAVLTSVIAACCRIKADVVMIDERELGPRRALNFGHTVGHALEALTHYRRFRHGEAIGYGMLAAAHLSASRGLLSDADHAALGALVAAMGRLPTVADLGTRDALARMTRDKKVVNGRLHFVLARGIGGTAIATDIEPRELTAAMRSIGMKA